ncbi:hypothetical protein QEN19_002022 [Hanseniaspora menglaensis]
MLKSSAGKLKLRVYGFAKRNLTFEGSTHLPSKFSDLTSQDGELKRFDETSRKMVPVYEPVPNIVLNSPNVPQKIIKDLQYLSKPPISPNAEECCGSGCEDNCVFIIYYNEFKHWKQRRHRFLDFLLKEETKSIITEKEYTTMVKYMGLHETLKNNVSETVTWPTKLLPEEWESPPLRPKHSDDLLIKEDIVERDIENHIPLDILQYDKLEQKLRERRERRDASNAAVS